MAHYEADLPFEMVLVAARSGEGYAWERLYRSFAPAIGGYLRLHGIRDVDDVTSEVFLGVVRNISIFEGDEAAFRSWLFVIAHRRVQDFWRSRARRPEPDELTEDIHDSACVEETAIGLLGTARVRQLIQELSADQREVLLLRILADMKIDDIASTLGRSPGAVKQLQRRALEAIRKALLREGVPQ